MAKRIKALCITEDPDRPTTAMFVGLKNAGVDVTVVCPTGEPRAWLEAQGVRVLDLPLRKQFDRDCRAAPPRRAGTRPLRCPAPLQQQSVAERSRREPRAAREDRRLPRHRRQRELFQPRLLDEVLEPVASIASSAWRTPCATTSCRCARRFCGCLPERLVTIYKGHSLDWYRAAAADLTTLGVPAGSFAIACVANYRPRKGIEVLVDAFGRLPARCKRICS